MPHHIELNLQDINQLFNTMDPSPFNEKDLDHDAEEFIVSWMREFPLDEPVTLVVYLSRFPTGADAHDVICHALHHYFAYRMRINQLEFNHLLKEGRFSLLIGLAFLAACLITSEFLTNHTQGTLTNLARESLTIGGWVAMWRPMQIYLYDWWPLRHFGKIYQKLSTIPVEVRSA